MRYLILALTIAAALPAAACCVRFEALPLIIKMPTPPAPVPTPSKCAPYGHKTLDCYTA